MIASGALGLGLVLIAGAPPAGSPAVKLADFLSAANQAPATRASTMAAATMMSLPSP